MFSGQCVTWSGANCWSHATIPYRFKAALVGLPVTPDERLTLSGGLDPSQFQAELVRTVQVLRSGRRKLVGSPQNSEGRVFCSC